MSPMTQTHQSALNTASGCTASSVTRRLVLATGLAGTVQQPNSSVLVAYSITKRRTLVTGLRTLPVAKNIVS